MYFLPQLVVRLQLCGFRGDSDIMRVRAIGGADFLQTPERSVVKEEHIRKVLLLW